MDKKVAFVTIVVLLNSVVMLVGFGYLHNEIIELKTEGSDLSEVPAPTEPEQLQEPEPEPTPEPEPQPAPDPDPEAEPEPQPQQPVEPEPTEPIHKLMAPVANLSVVSWEFDDTRGSGEGGDFLATVEGDIVNPNNCTLYNVEICLDFHIMQGRTAIILGFFSEKRTINVGTMVAGRSIKIKPQTYAFGVIDWSSLLLNNFSYTVNWDESR